MAFMNNMAEENNANGRNRREWSRILVDLEVDYGSSDTFLFAYIRDISETGIFIYTHQPEPPGTRLNLRFMPDDNHPHLMQLEGEVIWVNAYRPASLSNLNPGMGVRFVGLEGETRRRLTDYVKTFAFLDEPEEASSKVAASSDEEKDPPTLN